MLFTAAVKYSILLSLTLAAFRSQDDSEKINAINFRQTCTGIPGREAGKIGKMSAYVYTKYTKPIYNNSDIHGDRCSYYCFQNPNCRSAVYVSDKMFQTRGTCYIYNRSFHKYLSLHGDVYLSWEACKTNNSDYCLSRDAQTSSTVMKSNRCQGYWFRYFGYNFLDKSRIMDIDETYTSVSSAQHACLKSISCGGFQSTRMKSGRMNYILYQGSPHNLELNLNKSEDQLNNIADIWKCSDCTEHLNLTKWNITQNSTYPSKKKKYLASFYTSSAQECRLECERSNLIYKNIRVCHKVYYNKSINLCLILSHNDKSDRCADRVLMNEVLNGSKMVEYTLNTSALSMSAVEDENIPDKESILNNYVENHKNLECHCFTENYPVYRDICGEPDLSKKFLKNLKGIALKEAGKVIQNSPNYFLKFDTGYEPIWIEYHLPSMNSSCHDNNCLLFTAAILPPFSSTDVQFITRNVWEARSPGKMELLEPIKNIIVQSTVLPRCGCIGLNHCSDEIRAMQAFGMNKLHSPDIKYSFLVDDVGKIYEGRGWKYTNNAVTGFYWDSITIAFIGSFRLNAPTLFSLNSVKKFIQDAVDKKLLPHDYNLYHSFDASAIKTNIQINTTNDLTLRLILSNWPNYKGMIKPFHLCDLKWKLLIGISSGVLAFLMTFSLTVAYRTGYLHRAFCKETREILYNFISGAEIVNLFLFQFKEEALKSADCNITMLNKLKLYRLPTRHRINLNISKVCFAHIGANLVRCGCYRLIMSLYHLTQAKGKNNFIQLLSEAYFFKNCPNKTAIMIVQPRDKLEYSFMIVLHCDQLVTMREFIAKLFLQKLCLCRRFGLTWCSETSNQLIKSEFIDNIRADLSEAQLNWLQAMREERQKLISKGLTIRYKDIVHRDDDLLEAEE